MPIHLQLLNYVDRFGGQAIFGRPMGVQEIQKMMRSENIVEWYRQRQMSKDWTAWAKENKSASTNLNEAALLAAKMGLLNNGES